MVLYNVRQCGVCIIHVCTYYYVCVVWCVFAHVVLHVWSSHWPRHERKVSVPAECPEPQPTLATVS